MLKKQISFQREIETLTPYTILLFFQYTNLSTQDWQYLKKELHTDQGSGKHPDDLIVQNKTATRLFTKFIDFRWVELENEQKLIQIPAQNRHKFSQSSDNFVEKLIQGNTMIIGCAHLETIKIVRIICKQIPHLFFLGGLVGNHYITEQTLDQLSKKSDSTYLEFLQFLQTNPENLLSINTCQFSLFHQILLNKYEHSTN